MLATLLAPLFLVPSAAGECEGVLVVVEDSHRTESSCQRRGGTAAEVLARAGYRLDRVQRFPGAVCRLDGEPADAPCVAMPPADAYWGLFVAESGEWRYADLGVDALDLRRGDAVAMAWQDTVEPVPPTVEPDAAVATGGGASADEGPAPAAADAPAGDADGGGVASWVPFAGGVLLLGAVAALALRRRT